MKTTWIKQTALAGLVTFLTVPAWGVEIIAHRGASAEAPENTVASVRLAWKKKCDASEVDIYLTRDNQVVVLHDENTKRTTGVDRKVDEATLEELRKMDAGAWKGERWKGEKIPTLSEVLATVPDGKRIFIEIKCGPEVLPALKKILQSTDLGLEQTVIIGFSWETMRQAKEMLPGRPVYWLAGFKQEKETGVWTPAVDELIARAKAAKVDGLNVSYKGPLDLRAIAKIKEAGLGVYVWTVNDAGVARRLADAGIEGITTDKPAWLRQELSEKNHE